MERWRKLFLQKLNTKAFNDVDFSGTFQAVLEDENTNIKKVSKKLLVII